jgi:hypothetical protein
MIAIASTATPECAAERSSVALKVKRGGPSRSKTPRTQAVAKYRRADIKEVSFKDLFPRAKKELWREVIFGEVSLFAAPDDRQLCVERCVKRAEEALGLYIENRECEPHSSSIYFIHSQNHYWTSRASSKR